MFSKIEKGIGIIGSILLFCLMILTFVDVVGRNGFNRPLPGASELTEIMLAAVIFLMLPAVAYRNQHIVIDLIENVINRGTKAFLDIFSALCSAFFFGLVSWQMWVLADKAIGYGDASPTLHIPLGPVLYAVSVLSAFNALAFLLTIPRAFSDRPADESEAPVIV